MDVSRNKQLRSARCVRAALGSPHLLSPSDDEDDKGHWVVGNDWCRWSYQVCLVGK